LAWLTYLFVEKKLRFQKSKFISLGLLTSLLLIGSVGYFIELQKGYPNRYIFETIWTEGEIGNDAFRKKELNFKQDCIDKFENGINEKSYCLIENAELEPTALLVGDSHANHLYSGLIQNNALTGGNLLNRGAGACFPFYDNPSAANTMCPTLIDGLLEMAQTTTSIKTIILAGRAITELNEEHFLPKINTLGELNSTSNEENNPYLIFKNGMQKTLQRLTAANKQIVFVLDTPDLEFDPIACLNRPWRLDESALKTMCAVPRSQVNSRRQKYLEIVMPILNEFPNVKVFDPLPALCDENYCWAVKDKKLLYRDHDHLNETGAIYLGEYFARQIKTHDNFH
jgi:hypothetical protein